MTTLAVGDPIPHVLTKQQLAEFTGYSLRQIDTFRARRNHPGIVELEGPGHPRFKGAALKAWLDGGAAQPTARRYFGAGRSQAVNAFGR